MSDIYVCMLCMYVCMLCMHVWLGLTAIVLIASIGTVHVAIASQFRCNAIARVAASDER